MARSRTSCDVALCVMTPEYGAASQARDRRIALTCERRRDQQVRAPRLMDTLLTWSSRTVRNHNAFRRSPRRTRRAPQHLRATLNDDGHRYHRKARTLLSDRVLASPRCHRPAVDAPLGRFARSSRPHESAISDLRRSVGITQDRGIPRTHATYRLTTAQEIAELRVR